KWCERRNARPGYDNFQSFYTATLDAALAAQQFCTAAELCGLGVCYLGTTTYNAPQIIEALSLPKLVVPVTTVTVGYPAEIPGQVERLPLEAVVHAERYNDYSDGDIDRLYADKEALPENRKFVTENGKETLAQVFTDVRYPKANNEYFSEVFLRVIREQGFLL
ncbi:MAG: nitroreductase family protein, partial [Coprobacter sp.]|nr:nitroreductase family protein [Coprobacter sp.]